MLFPEISAMCYVLFHLQQRLHHPWWLQHHAGLQPSDPWFEGRFLERISHRTVALWTCNVQSGCLRYTNVNTLHLATNAKNPLLASRMPKVLAPWRWLVTSSAVSIRWCELFMEELRSLGSRDNEHERWASEPLLGSRPIQLAPLAAQ